LNGYLRNDYAKFFILVFSSICVAIGGSFFYEIHRTAFQKIYLRFQISTQSDYKIKLYYNIGNGWREEYSEEKYVYGGPDFTTVMFSLPNTNIEGIRLDLPPSDKEMYLRALSQIDYHNLTLKRFSVGKVKPRKGSVTISLNEDTAVIKPLTQNPELELDIANKLIRHGKFKINIFLLVFIVFFSLSAKFLEFKKKLMRKHPLGEIKTENETSYNPFRRIEKMMIMVAFCLIPLSFYHLKIESKPIQFRKQRIGNKEEFINYNQDIQNVTFKRDDGLSVSGTLYGIINRPKVKSVFLLLHGNYREGRQFPLYPVIATELANKGNIVLSMDFSGYGDSESPYLSEFAKDVSLELETRAAIDYLAHLPIFQSPVEIGIIGHSMGAQPALWVGIDHPSVKSIALIGPPRRIWERFNHNRDREYFWHRALRNWNVGEDHKNIPTWLKKEVWNEQILWKDIVHTIPNLCARNHKPVLLIDGETESDSDKAYLLWFYQQIAYPKKYVELGGADHQCNVYREHKMIEYDSEVMDKLIEVINDWQGKNDDIKAKSIAKFNNGIRWLFSFQ
jgi:pimeloyl-ACP methyl ester carboxylesterase